MATLVLGAVGTLVGGPLGGAIGTLVGRQVDSALVGNPSRDGPRLKDLAVSTSSYGQPIPRHFGRMRVAGTIIWSTDLVEQEEHSGGGKGKPKTTTFSYSVSMAVALSSRPIARLGRIWADGNLLRGGAGDLKTGGTLRFHAGNADQQPDPLMAAALGAECPAYRGTAYVVFEDLQLSDFGNRIPALTFEILDEGTSGALAEMVAPSGAPTDTSFAIEGLEGFSHEAGTYTFQLAALVPALNPCVSTDTDVPVVYGSRTTAGEPRALPEPIAWADGEFGAQSGAGRSGSARPEVVKQLRYYDIERDYQPGIQRAPQTVGDRSAAALELAGAFRAGAAGRLVRKIAGETSTEGERIAYRIASLDESFFPGELLRIPGHSGLWAVEGWEWRDGGIELELTRHIDAGRIDSNGQSGHAWLPLDRLPGATSLRAFELPWDGTGSPSRRVVYAAVGAGNGRWSGAQVYAQQDDTLLPLNISADRRAIIGHIFAPLAPSPGLLFEPQATLEVQLLDSSQDLQPVTDAQIVQGANRALVGGELLQFRDVEPMGNGRFRLGGLLRGRGATEAAAMIGHLTGTPFTLVDGRLLAIESAAITGTGSLAALAVDSENAVTADVEGFGMARRPLPPVHSEADWKEDGSVDLCWIRRSRGAWLWPTQVEVPLVEEAEHYEVGIGAIEAPLASFAMSQPSLALSVATLDALLAPAGTGIWVRQVGDHGRSAATFITETT